MSSTQKSPLHRRDDQSDGSVLGVLLLGPYVLTRQARWLHSGFLRTAAAIPWWGPPMLTGGVVAAQGLRPRPFPTACCPPSLSASRLPCSSC